MNRFARRSLIGAAAGLLASLALVFTLGQPLLGVALGIASGAAFSASLPPTRGTYVDNLMAAGALGVPLWGVFSVIALPLLSGQMPQWGAEQMRQHFPSLVGWVIYGSGLGLFTQALSDMAGHFFGPEAAPRLPSAQEKIRVVILGGGFGGNDDRGVSRTTTARERAGLGYAGERDECTSFHPHARRGGRKQPGA